MSVQNRLFFGLGRSVFCRYQLFLLFSSKIYIVLRAFAVRIATGSSVVNSIAARLDNKALVR